MFLDKDDSPLDGGCCVFRVRVVEIDVKANVLSGRFLGEPASKSKRVRVTKEGVNRGMLTWALTLAATGLMVGGVLDRDAFLDEGVEASGADSCAGCSSG